MFSDLIFFFSELSLCIDMLLLGGDSSTRSYTGYGEGGWGFQCEGLFSALTI